MNKITIMKGSEVLFTLESSFIPNEGELIWFDSSVNNPLVYKITGRIIDLDKQHRRFNVTLLVE